MSDEYTAYFSGKKLYGDDFSPEQIAAWFQDEAEAYADLGAREKSRYSYGYHQLNEHHAFRHIRHLRFERALGLGSAYGDEFNPIADRIAHITIIDPSDAFTSVRHIRDTPCEYQKPATSGDIAFGDATFDLIVCLGALHHIPNVSHVIRECHRCLKNGGVMLLREPVVSMGDWRRPRPGLTMRERGIPLQLLDNIVARLGFKTMRRTACDFPPVARLADRLGIQAYNSRILTRADALLSMAFAWNAKYHRTNLHDRFAPASVYYVLKK